MYAVLAQIARFIAPSPGQSAPGKVGRNLMESAEARAGQDPHHAQELRSAAQAWLRVVR